jgi:hypothetical protein
LGGLDELFVVFVMSWAKFEETTLLVAEVGKDAEVESRVELPTKAEVDEATVGLCTTGTLDTELMAEPLIAEVEETAAGLRSAAVL